MTRTAPHRRRAILLLALAAVLGAGCGSSGAGPASSSQAPLRCPATWAAGWQRWADRVGDTVYCPTWMPSPIDAVIGGQWNTAQVPQRQWQLGFAWLEQGQLVHVIFEGYPPGTFPPRCEGGVPCFDGREPGTERIGRWTVAWYLRNHASHTGHVAAVFRAGTDTEVVSIHVADPVTTRAIAKADLRHIIRGLVPVHPS